jgi:hypothetical protein
MSIYTETRIISLNSENATIYKNGTFLSDLVFGFSGILRDDHDIIQRQLTLVNAQIPVSFYIINVYNRVFVLRNISTATDYTITLSVGNYNSTTFITLLQNTISSVSGMTFVITIDKATGKLTFSSTESWTLVSTSSLTTANAIIGLNPLVNLTSTLVGAEYVAVCPNPLNLLGIKQLQIKCSSVSCNNFSSNNNNAQSSLLATIPVNVGAFGLILYESSAGNDITFHNATLDDIDILIVDSEDGEPINFNGIGWTMTLLLHITRIADLGIKERDMRKITTPLSTNLPLSEANSPLEETPLAKTSERDDGKKERDDGKKEKEDNELRILES